MRSDQLLQRVRLNTGTDDTHVDYPDSVLLSELNDSMHTTFEDMVVKARAGYWLHPFDFSVTAGQPKYRIPARAVAGGLECVEIAMSADPQFVRLHEVPQSDAENWQRAPSILRQPLKFVVRGDQVVLLPNPDATAYTLRMWCYIRPSRLVVQQSAALTGFTERGRVTAVNTTARTVQVNVIPFDQEAIAAGVITPAAITSGLQSIDIVHPDGWHELALASATQTFSGTTFTIGGTADMSEIQIGDYVRVAEQTDWPMLPDDFHRCLADVTSVKVCAQRGLSDKAGDFASAVSADIARFADILQPRIRAESRVVRAPLPGIRGRRWYWPSYP